MSYQAGEALWLARLRDMSQFDGNNSGRGNWKLLNTGKASQYAILKPGEHTREMMSITTRLNHYQTIIQLWQKYTEDGQSLIDLETLTSAVIAYIDTWPRLTDTTNSIQGAKINTIRELQQVPPDGPVWILAELVGEWDEEQSVTFAE